MAPIAVKGEAVWIECGKKLCGFMGVYGEKDWGTVYGVRNNWRYIAEGCHLPRFAVFASRHNGRGPDSVLVLRVLISIRIRACTV